MAAPGENLRINPDRLWNSIHELAEIGPGVAGGSNRQTLTDDDAKRKAIAEAMQVRVSESPTHIFAGQWVLPAAVRKNISGNLESPVTIFWNIEKK